MRSLHRFGAMVCGVLGFQALAGDVAAGWPADQTDALHYDLDLTIDPLLEWIVGTNTIRVRAVEDGVTVFHLRLDDQLEITAVRLNDEPAEWERIEFPTVEVTLDRPYAAGEEFTVAVDYQGSPEGDDCTSFGCRGMRFQMSPPRPVPVVSTASQPWLAYHWLPGKDDNRDKTTATLGVTVPDPLVVAANGTLKSVEPLGGGRTRYVWQSTYPMVDSLYSVCATDYSKYVEYWEHQGRLMPVEFYLFPEEDTPEHRDVLALHLDMLDVFSDLFGTYPFIDEKYGVAQYGFGNLLEHQTLTSMGLFPANPMMLETVFAHELAHQWWGDLVTAATWNHMWLQEGFATYAQALWDEHKPGAPPDALKWAMWGHHPIDMQGTVYVFDEDISDWCDIYTLAVYNKGAWVLHMLRYIVGRETFFDLLHTYRARYEYASAETDDFIAVAEEVSGQKLGWFFDQWLYEEGYPKYDCGVRQEEMDGQHYIELYVRQTQPPEYVTFAAPVEIGDPWTADRYVFWNDAPAEHVLIPTEGPIENPSIDPDWWLLHLGSCGDEFVEGPPKVIDVLPAPFGVHAPDGGGALKMAFHKDVVAKASDFVLADAGGTPLDFDWSYDAQTRTVTVLPPDALPPGKYILTASDTMVDAAAGLSLDGEVDSGPWDPLLPSGDGLPGGDAVVPFIVASGLAGDLDADGGIDLEDLALLVGCLTGPGGGAGGWCQVGDADGDSDVDLLDFARFQLAFTGS